MSTYTHFETYDFDNDPSFQAGLPSILGSATESMSDEQKSQLIDRAKWFYYSKTKEPFDYNEYLEWKAERLGDKRTAEGSTDNTLATPEPQPTVPSSISTEPSATTAATSSPGATGAPSTEPSYPRSFADIVELIQSGKPIPGIRDIPNKINEDEPTQAELAPKPKPWEQ